MQLFDLIENRGLKRSMVVLSMAGHDSKRIFIVVKVEGRYAWIVDGHLRPVEKMKKKKVRHLCALGSLADPMALDEAFQQVQDGEKNARVRKLIKQFVAANQPGQRQPAPDDLDSQPEDCQSAAEQMTPFE